MNTQRLRTPLALIGWSLLLALALATSNVRCSLVSGQTVVPATRPATRPSPAPAVARLTGTPIGTPGSYRNAGNVAANAFDGDLTTFVDAPAGDGDWCGQDFGSAKRITAVRFAARAGWSPRMRGGTFAASNDPAFAAAVPLYIVPDTATPPSATLTTVAVSAPCTYRYARYRSPNGGYGNVAEVEFDGLPADAPLVAAPLAVLTTATLPVVGIDGNNNVVAGVPTATYAAAPVGHAVHETVVGEWADPHEWLKHAYRVDWGDGSPAEDYATAAHRYAAAGTYRLAVTVDAGPPQVVTVTVPPSTRTVYYVAPGGSDANPGTDPAAPLRTADAAAAKLLARKGGHTEIRFAVGTIYPTTTGLALNHLSDVLITSYGVGSKPVLASTPNAKGQVPGPIDYWYDTTDATVAGLQITSPLAADGSPSSMLHVRGANVAFDGDDWGNLGDAVSAETVAGLYGNNCRQVGLVWSRNLMVLGCSDLVWTGCVATDSATESSIRSTSNGITRGTIADGSLARHNVNKANLTLRAASQVDVVRLAATGAALSFNTDNSGTDTESDCRFRGCTLTGAAIEMHPGNRRCQAVGNTVANPTAAAIADSAGPVGNLYAGNTLSGPEGIKFYAPSDATATGNLFAGASRSQLFSFSGGDGGAGVVDGGGNVRVAATRPATASATTRP